jgi:hypothetical protein
MIQLLDPFGGTLEKLQEARDWHAEVLRNCRKHMPPGDRTAYLEKKRELAHCKLGNEYGLLCCGPCRCDLFLVITR